jgi:CXXX repeat modification system protein
MAQEFSLNEDQVNEIRELFEELSSLKALARDTFNEVVSATIVEKMIQTQSKYDKWFANIESQLSVNTTPQNHWEVDFDSNKIVLH